MKNDLASFKQLNDSILTGVETEFSTVINIGDYKIKLFSNSPELLRKLDNYYQAFIGSGKKKVEPEIEIRITCLETLPRDLAIYYQRPEPKPGKTEIKEVMF